MYMSSSAFEICVGVHFSWCKTSPLLLPHPCDNKYPDILARVAQWLRVYP